MDDKLGFVQFLHPGGEHKPDSGLVKNWNERKHKRKFLRRSGVYIVDARTKKGEMLFWGEWEPKSRAEKIDHPVNHGPLYVYEPYYVVPKSYKRMQNTDPFVFGKHFFYTGCQQRTKKGATQLRYLSRGSVILFGSCEDRSAFVLDTVFVVDHWIDHTRTNYQRALRGAIPREYREVTMGPWYQGPCAESTSCAPAGETWRLYYGVRHSDPLHGMYSFFPCQPYEGKPKGFARPRICLPSKITNNLTQGKKLTEQPNLGEMELLWRKVADQVKRQGLALGVHAEMPQRRP